MRGRDPHDAVLGGVVDEAELLPRLVGECSRIATELLRQGLARQMLKHLLDLDSWQAEGCPPTGLGTRPHEEDACQVVGGTTGEADFPADRFLGGRTDEQQGGFLHADRPGRDSLAQDILEEFRAWWIDRLVLSLVNRKQIHLKDFSTEASGAVQTKDDARKSLFQALQAKKQEKITHPYLQEEVEIGLLPYIQALLLARYLRGDLEQYPPFLMR